MGQGLRFPIVTLLINYILSLVTGAHRFHSQRTKPGSVFCHPVAPAGIPCRWASSCEGSLGHQETSPAGTFLRVCARDTTSVCSGENPAARLSPSPSGHGEEPGGRVRAENGLLCFSQFPAQLIRSTFPRFIREVGRQDWN